MRCPVRNGSGIGAGKGGSHLDPGDLVCFTVPELQLPVRTQVPHPAPHTEKRFFIGQGFHHFVMVDLKRAIIEAHVRSGIGSKLPCARVFEAGVGRGFTAVEVCLRQRWGGFHFCEYADPQASAAVLPYCS